MAIRLMVCFARSGGSLLNQCLGCLPNVIILSEINPLGGGWGEKGYESYTTPREQAKNWYGIELQSEDYLESIQELHTYCIENNKYLIIRDWSFVNFFPYFDNNFSPPGKLLNYELLKTQFEIIPFGFVRDAIDVWISMGLPDTKSFFSNYLNYIHSLSSFDIQCFKYENFCKDPSSELRKICTFLNIPFSESYKDFSDFKNLNGDLQASGENTSRGKQDRIIKPLVRKRVPDVQVELLNRNNDLIAANRLMKYPIRYENSNFLFKEVKKTIKKILK